MNKILIVSERREDVSLCSKVEKVDVEHVLHTNENLSAKSIWHMLTIDSGSPSNIVGRKTFKDIYNAYPRAIALQLRYESSNKKFEFGGGEVTKSLGKFIFQFISRIIAMICT